MERLRSAIAFVPIGWSEPYATLAQAYADAGDPDRAEWAAAMADLSEGRYAAAASRLEAIIDGPAALEATIGLALVSEVQGDATAAAGWYQKALEIEPGNAEARLGLSRVSLPGAAAGTGEGAPEGPPRRDPCRPAPRPRWRWIPSAGAGAARSCSSCCSSAASRSSSASPSGISSSASPSPCRSSRPRRSPPTRRASPAPPTRLA